AYFNSYNRQNLHPTSAETHPVVRPTTPPGYHYNTGTFHSPPGTGYQETAFKRPPDSPPREPSRAPKSQAMSISQLLSDKTSRDVTPEFMEPSPVQNDEQQRTRTASPNPASWTHHQTNNNAVHEQLPTKESGQGVSTRYDPVQDRLIYSKTDEASEKTLPKPQTTSGTAASLSSNGITSSTADQPYVDGHTTHAVADQPTAQSIEPLVTEKPMQDVDMPVSNHAPLDPSGPDDKKPKSQTDTSTTASSKKGRPKALAAQEKKSTKVKVEESASVESLTPGDQTPVKPKRGRKPKVKGLTPTVHPIVPIKPKLAALTVYEPSVETPAVLTETVVPDTVVGAASKRTRSESPVNGVLDDSEPMDIETINVRNGTSSGRISPKLFTSDDDSDQEDYSQHPELMAYRLEVHKRAQRVQRAYERQLMAKRRKLHEKFLAKQQRRNGVAEEEEVEQEEEPVKEEEVIVVQEPTPPPAPTPAPTKAKGGRGRKKVQPNAEDESAVKTERAEEPTPKETKAEKRKRERREAAEAAALAKAQELHGKEEKEEEDEEENGEEEEDITRVAQLDDSDAESNAQEETNIDDADQSAESEDEALEEPEEDQEMLLKRQEAQYEAKRREIWDLIAQVQIPQMNKILASSTSTRLQNCKLVAQMCRRYARKAAARSVKLNKDIQARAKRATREMLTFWKRNEREELLLRKKAEKEAIEKLRIEEEMREARRQARKLNFLITQTELYSHFIGKKIGTEAAEADDDAAPVRMRPSEGGPDSIVQDPDHMPIEGEPDFEEASDEALEAQAKWGAQQALLAAQARTKAFDEDAKEEHKNVIVGHSKTAHGPNMANAQADLDEMNFQNPSSMPTIAEIEQPTMLMCQLKGYQIKGLNWLANLYEQGINGILADEMGLGKTVQSISLMAHLAETHNIWGPFLVIAPASTLHNWQQEFTKFTPALRALPYWGDPNDRMTLRKVWCRKQIYNKDSPFHVLITSYQLVVSDEKYFQRVKWQYMVLDEAQAIKSSSSNRWKTLLGFNCRNRLLLTGTPIQNSMQELWALLHFIMPSLFDSHEEFSEWFSKDIESHAENKGTLNEHQLRRLHMILKPFMLRRIKKNVQNELGDKIELELSCELTARQRALYRGLKAKISIAELLEKASALEDTDSVDSLMNLVMQFRKVCNHPELFERADVVSPLALCEFSQTPSIAREGDDLYLANTTKSLVQFTIPKCMYREGGILTVPSEKSRAGTDTKYLDTLMNIWQPSHITESMWDDQGAFSFLRFSDESASEASRIFRGHLLERFAIDLERRGQRSARGVIEYDENDNVAESTFARFLISELSEPLSQRNQGLYRHSQALCQVLSKSELGEYLPMMESAYRPKAVAPPIEMICSDRRFLDDQQDVYFNLRMRQLLNGVPEFQTEAGEHDPIVAPMMDLWRVNGGCGLLGELSLSSKGYSSIEVPQMKQLIMDSGKLAILDKLLVELKAGGHRVLLYFQMTKMIDLMEEYLTYRQYKYLRLDGSSKISDRRDMVTDWQTRPEIFIFLLSTRAGGLGINLTAADTVIFYDSDWNPTVDQQAMDRAHRLGQTRQVTVYRLITKGTIEERILQRAKQKDEIQKVVISGGEFKQSVEFKPREIVSLLLDDDELAGKLQEQQLKRKAEEEAKMSKKSGSQGKEGGRPSKRSKKDGNSNASGSGSGVAMLLAGSRDVSAAGTTVSTPSATAVVLSTPGRARTLDEMWAEIDAQQAAMEAAAAAQAQAEEEEAARLKALSRKRGGLGKGPRMPKAPKEKVIKEKVVKEKVPKEPKPKKEKVIKENKPTKVGKKMGDSMATEDSAVLGSEFEQSAVDMDIDVDITNE
ncbi:putative DNA helicase ino80, partial [Podila epigama]